MLELHVEKTICTLDNSRYRDRAINVLRLNKLPENIAMQSHHAVQHCTVDEVTVHEF